MRRRKSRIDRINEILEMPAEVVSNIPKISILGFGEIIIENYKNIMEYEDFYIKVNTHIGLININGLNLKLIQMNHDDIKIMGRIDSLDFEEYEEAELEEI
jgi:sporulation protein YqfC